MKRFMKVLFLVGSLAFLTGCATEKNVELSDNFWQQKHQKITVARAKTPKPQVHQIGNQGLLEMAINIQMAKPVDESLAKTDTNWYPGLQQSFVKKLREHGMLADANAPTLDLEHMKYLRKDISQYPNLDYASVVTPLNINTFLVIKLDALGAVRNYYGFLPLNDPQAYCSLTGELIDAKDQHLLWRYHAKVTIPVKGPWDQPPNYPNLNNAVKLAEATAQQEVLDNFFSGH